jgi:hypothetical protein
MQSLEDLIFGPLAFLFCELASCEKSLGTRAHRAKISRHFYLYAMYRLKNREHSENGTKNEPKVVCESRSGSRGRKEAMKSESVFKHVSILTPRLITV